AQATWDESKCHWPRDKTIPRRRKPHEMSPRAIGQETKLYPEGASHTGGVQVPLAKRRNYTPKAQATWDESKCHRPRDETIPRRRKPHGTSPSAIGQETKLYPKGASYTG
nr:hypothetical protein [Tanacetum cinerariifolium]